MSIYIIGTSMFRIVPYIFMFWRNLCLMILNTHTHTHTHIYIYIYIYTCVGGGGGYVWVNMSHIVFRHIY